MLNYDKSRAEILAGLTGALPSHLANEKDSPDVSASDSESLDARNQSSGWDEWEIPCVYHSNVQHLDVTPIYMHVPNAENEDLDSYYIVGFGEPSLQPHDEDDCPVLQFLKVQIRIVGLRSPTLTEQIDPKWW